MVTTIRATAYCVVPFCQECHLHLVLTTTRSSYQYHSHFRDVETKAELGLSYLSHSFNGFVMHLPNATVTYKSAERWRHMTGTNRNYVPNSDKYQEYRKARHCHDLTEHRSCRLVIWKHRIESEFATYPHLTHPCGQLGIEFLLPPLPVFPSPSFRSMKRSSCTYPTGRW